MGNYMIIGGYDSGIGKAIMEHLDEVGHTVIGTDKTLDVRDTRLVYSAIKTGHEMIVNEYGCIDGLVYCPGVNHLEWIGKWGEAGISGPVADIFSVNSIGFLTVLDALVKEVNLWRTEELEAAYKDGHLFRAPPVSVVAISSDAATRPLRASAPYCASKAALDAIIRVAGRELGPSNYRVNAVSPGMVEGTGMSDQMDEMIPRVRGWTPEEALHYEKSQEVVPGRVSPEEVSKVVLDVLTGPAHLNGAIIPINGGR